MLVAGQFLLEERDLATCVLFTHVLQLLLVFVLRLRLLVAKVLLLSLNDHVQLCLLSLDLLNQFLKVCNLFEVLNFLRGNLLVEQILLFLVSDLVFELALAH